MQELKTSIDSGVELVIPDDSPYQHEFACLVKLFLRELPNPLLCFKNYENIIELSGSTKEEYIESFQEIIKGLPKHYRNLLVEIFVFLEKVVKKSSLNKMNSSNLAIVFGMNIIKPKKDDPLKMIEDCKKVNDACEILIDNYKVIFDIKSE
jgi:Rho GTPase-activating protein 22/24/25